jgi:hypothetical protein
VCLFYWNLIKGLDGEVGFLLYFCGYDKRTECCRMFVPDGIEGEEKALVRDVV